MQTEQKTTVLDIFNTAVAGYFNKEVAETQQDLNNRNYMQGGTRPEQITDENAEGVRDTSGPGSFTVSPSLLQKAAPFALGALLLVGGYAVYKALN